MRSLHEELLRSKAGWLSLEQALEQAVRSRGSFLFFFIRTIFLLERISDKLWLFTLGLLTDIFVKMNRLSQMVIAVNDKIQALKQKLDFSKTCVST